MKKVEEKQSSDVWVRQGWSTILHQEKVTNNVTYRNLQDGRERAMLISGYKVFPKKKKKYKALEKTAFLIYKSLFLMLRDRVIHSAGILFQGLTNFKAEIHYMCLHFLLLNLHVQYFMCILNVTLLCSYFQQRMSHSFLYASGAATVIFFNVFIC